MERSARAGWPTEDLLSELGELARTAGALVVGTLTQARPRPHPATLIGKGKVDELAARCEEERVDLIIFHDSLSPAQTRNLENAVNCRVVDRTQLILDIFAQRAHTREGKLQVELAQLNYYLPRLTGRGRDLSRLAGGIGTRGPGETKLETDRRRIRERIRELQSQIEDIRRQRATMRGRRQTNRVPVVALVGYTNAGKSTLLARLTDTDTLVEDRLFATLDPLTRRFQLPDSSRLILLSDTVGFIRDLPHHLVAAFSATLEEVVQADVLIHVVDASHPRATQMLAAVNDVLRQLGALEKPTVTAFNKADLLAGVGLPAAMMRGTPNPVLVSAAAGYGLDKLSATLERLLEEELERIVLCLPYERMDLVSMVHEHGRILNLQYESDGIHLEALVTEPVARRLAAVSIAD